MAQTFTYWPVAAGAKSDPSPVHVMFMADRVTLGQVLFVLIQLPLPLSFCEGHSLIHLPITDIL